MCDEFHPRLDPGRSTRPLFTLFSSTRRADPPLSQPTAYCSHATQPTVPSAKRSQSAPGVCLKAAAGHRSGPHTHTHVWAAPDGPAASAERGGAARAASKSVLAKRPTSLLHPSAGPVSRCKARPGDNMNRGCPPRSADAAGPSGAAQTCVRVCGPERCPAAAYTRATAAYPGRALGPLGGRYCGLCRMCAVGRGL